MFTRSAGQAGAPFAIALVLGFASASSPAVTLVGHDLAGPFAPYDWNAPPGSDLMWGVNGDIRKAVGVTLGAGPDYWFDSMTAVLHFITAEGYLPSDRVTAGIYEDAGGNPGVLKAALGTIEISTVSFEGLPYIFTAPGPVRLEGGRNYWFVLGDESHYTDFGLPFVHWTVMSSRALPADGAATLAGYRWTVDGGTSWNNSALFNVVQIAATPVPEPLTPALLLAGLGVVGSVVRRRRIGSR